MKLHEQSDQDKVKNNASKETKENPLLKGTKLSGGSSNMKNVASVSDSTDMDDLSSDLSSKVSDVGKSATSVGKKAISNVGQLKKAPQRAKEAIQNFKKQMKKTGEKVKKATKRIAKIKALVIKAIMAVVHLIMAFWPILLTLVVVIIISSLVFKFMDNASVKGNQFVETETISEYNNVNYTDNGKLEITEVTMANKLVRAFYTYFSEKSIWVITDGKMQCADGSTVDSGVSTDGKILQYRSPEYIELFGDPDDPDSEQVGDKYNRESQFYINPNALYVLDKYLHDGQFRFPEQIVKHVAIKENESYGGDDSTAGTIEKGTVINIPSGLGNVHTYMGWGCITAPDSMQYKLRAQAGEKYDNEGFGKINGRYVIACTETYGKVGDYIDFYREDGQVLKCIIGDIKSSSDAGCNKWGHSNGQNIVEFVVNMNTWYSGGAGSHANPGTPSCHPNWNTCIVKAINGGSYFDNPNFTGDVKGNKDEDKKDDETTDDNQTTSGAYAGWKQTDPRWGSMRLPGGGTVHDIGCYATSSCVLAAYAGATSKDESKFNPAIGIPQLSYAGDALYMGSISNLGDGSLTYVETRSCYSLQTAVNTVKNTVDQGYFYIVRIGDPNTHFMPVLGVTDNDLIVNDVGRANYPSPTNLSEILSVDGRPLTELRVYKSSKTNMKECGNVSYEGGSSSGSLSSVPYELAQLTDDKRDLIAESTKYKTEKVEEKQYVEKTKTETRTVNNAYPGQEVEVNSEVQLEDDGTETPIKTKKVKVPADAVYDIYTGYATNATYEVTVHYKEETGTETKTYYTPTDEKEKGVWDYGFGSVVSYKKYEEKQENRGKITSFEVWDPNSTYLDENGNKHTGQKITVTPQDYNNRKDSEGLGSCEFDLNQEYKWGEQSSETYMIDWVITPAGTITNSIDYSWEDTGSLAKRSEPETISKTYQEKVRKTVEKSVILQPGEKITVSTNEVPGEDKKEVVLENQTDNPMEKKYDCIVEETQDVTVTLNATIEGSLWKIEPRYATDDVDLSGITGIRYYEDYLYNYDGYIPNSVKGKFNFDEIKARTGKDKKGLDQILANQSFGDGTTNTDFFDDEGLYVGIGAIQAIYERGAEYGEMEPGHVESDGITPGWGVSNMYPPECESFLQWVKEKDSAFYSKYFGGVDINPNDLNGAFATAWKQCGDAEKEQFTLYQISYSWKSSVIFVMNNKRITGDTQLSQIDFNRSYILQELMYSICCAGPEVAIQLLKSAGITANDTDADIIRKVGARFSSPDFYQPWYNSMFWDGVVNRWSESVESSQTNFMLKFIDENGEGDPYEWDEDDEMFVGGGGTSAGSSKNTNNIFTKMWRGIKKIYHNATEFVSKILFGTEEYTDVLQDKYWTKMSGAALQDNQADWVLSAMFAYNDQEEVTNYTIDDEYLKLMYEQMFSSQINNSGGVGSGVRNVYFKGKCSNPLSEDKDATITTKYNRKDSPVIVLSTKSKTKVKAVAEGKVIKKGFDAQYGGNYVMIQHSKCVSIYGNLASVTIQKNAKVKEGDVIGIAQSQFYFSLRTKMNGSYINPTEIFTGGDDTDIDFAVPANGMPIPTLYQIDYPQNSNDFPDGSSIYWAGCGFTSCAMVASYLTGKNITPKEIVEKFANRYYSDGMSWGLPAAVAEYYKLGKVTQTASGSGVLKALSEGKPVLSSQSPGIFTQGGHIIVLRGTDGKGKVFVNDPASRQRTNTAYDFKREVNVTSKQYWIFEGK